MLQNRYEKAKALMFDYLDMRRENQRGHLTAIELVEYRNLRTKINMISSSLRQRLFSEWLDLHKVK